MLLFLWIGCATPAGSDGTTDGPTDRADTAADDTGADDTSPDDTAAPTAFGALFPILSERCGGCHTSPYIGQFIEEGDITASWTLLREAVPHGDRRARYVVPGDPDGSLLLQKLSSAPPFGDPMPPENAEEEGLDAAEIEALRSWVSAGATLDG